MPLFTASLYLLCLAFLFGSAVFVYSRNPHRSLNGCYALLALALLAWVGSLFIFGTLHESHTLLTVGRINFAAAALVATAAYFFVAALAQRQIPNAAVLWAETLILVVLSLLTPLIDQAEMVRAGQHITVYGSLFFLYIIHVVGLLFAAVVTAFRPGMGLRPAVRTQLRLVGAGVLATAVIGITTNIVLPYWFKDFRFINVGTLSTILLISAISYAVSVHHLFNIRVIIRTTIIYAVLISLALEVYQAAVAFLADLLPFGDPTERHFAATAIALIINASTHDVLRSWLERLITKIVPKSHPGKRALQAGLDLP